MQRRYGFFFSENKKKILPALLLTFDQIWRQGWVYKRIKEAIVQYLSEIISLGKLKRFVLVGIE